MKISVITPTLFRSSLKQTVEGVAALLREGDEHIIVRDAAKQAKDPELYKALPTNEYTLFFEAYLPNSVFGNGQRDAAIKMARGDCLVFIDDDDLPCREAFDVLHELEPDPNVTHLFRMYRESDDRTYYPDKQRWGSIGGPMVVAPNRQDLPLWMGSNKYSSDFEWFLGVKALPDMRIETHKEIICLVSSASLGE